MSANDFLTFIIAIYGAVIASILGVRELQRDRRCVNVILEYVAFYERVQITIINIGHRPITITEIGMEVNIRQNGEGHWDPVPRNALFAPEVEEEPLPATLTDGEHITLPLSDVVGQSFMENGRLAKVFVYDVEGNVYSRFKIRLYDPKWGYYDKMSR